jgi:hypothetical protein
MRGEQASLPARGVNLKVSLRAAQLLGQRSDDLVQ